MDTWNTETTAEKERIPEWLVEIAELWTAQSATSSLYQEEYQQIRRLARAANIPPFVLIVRMFRDTYRVTAMTTKEQFQRCVDEQIAADGGQMFMHLAIVPSEENQRVAYAQELEEKAVKAAAIMKESIDADDDQKFKAASAECGRDQETWLIIAKRMTPEQARSAMVRFAQTDVTRWMEERLPGPPPLIFDCYRP